MDVLKAEDNVFLIHEMVSYVKASVDWFANSLASSFFLVANK
jgi:hypothetical protein